jgi:hypothetical protein
MGRLLHPQRSWHRRPPIYSQCKSYGSPVKTTLISHSQAPIRKPLLNVRDILLIVFKHFNIVTLEKRYATSTYSNPSDTTRLFRRSAKWCSGKSSEFVTSSWSYLYFQSSTARGTRPHSPAQHPRRTRAPLLERFSSLFLHSRSNTDGATQLQRLSRSIFSHHGPHVVEVPTVQDRKVCISFLCLSHRSGLIISVQALFVARPAQNTQQQAQSHGQGSSTAPPAPGTNAGTPGVRPANSRLVRLLAHLVLFLCCASPQHTGGNAHPTQQQSHGQAQTHVTSPPTLHQQGQTQAQASSSQTQPAAPSTSATPTILGAASVQPHPLPLRTRFILFLCCASLPHADGH